MTESLCLHGSLLSGDGNVDLSQADFHHHPFSEVPTLILANTTTGHHIRSVVRGATYT